MTRTMTFHDLRDAMKQPGCPICRLAHRAAQGYIDTLLWEMVNDPESRRDLRRAQGLCPDHSWRLVRGGPSLGATIIMHDVLQNTLRAAEAQNTAQRHASLAGRMLEHLRVTDGSAADRDEFLKRLEPQGRCPACEQVEITQRIATATLLENLSERDGMATEFQASEGLCLPHLRLAVKASDNSDTLNGLLGAQRAIWTRLVEHLGECIRKCDYRFSDEARGEETGACVRAITALVGARADQEDRQAGPVAFPFRRRDHDRP
jgi:hypothetical protein